MNDRFPKLTSHKVGNFDSRLLAVCCQPISELVFTKSLYIAQSKPELLHIITAV